jgi:hypothetical protein
MATMVINHCEVCGKMFQSKRKARYCLDNSTCRVSVSRAKKKAQKESEELMIPMETYVLYEAVCAAKPVIGSALNQMLKLHGKDAFTLMLHSMVYVLRVGE